MVTAGEVCIQQVQEGTAHDCEDPSPVILVVVNQEYSEICPLPCPEADNVLVTLS
jgi:hypothetical protein